jgi:hypothetical protein
LNQQREQLFHDATTFQTSEKREPPMVFTRVV